MRMRESLATDCPPAHSQHLIVQRETWEWAWGQLLQDLGVMDVATCEFPGHSATGGHASVDYGRFMAFLEREDGKITCLHQGVNVDISDSSTAMFNT